MFARQHKASFDNKVTSSNEGCKLDFTREFVCPEESSRYASALEQLIFKKLQQLNVRPTIVEFGSGTGEPVISAILNSKYTGVVHGYEINSQAYEIADQLIIQHGLEEQYIVHNTSFFETSKAPQANYLIANPPYLPCDNAESLLLPYLWGGHEGNSISKKLLDCGYQNVHLEVSSYSNPKDLIAHASQCGYAISDFIITRMPFGIYSRQDIVQKCLHDMKGDNKAFYSNNCYLVGSASFTKEPSSNPDLSKEFLACLTAI